MAEHKGVKKREEEMVEVQIDLSFCLITRGILWKYRGLSEGEQKENSARPFWQSSLPWIVLGDEADQKEGCFKTSKQIWQERQSEQYHEVTVN